MSAKKEFIYLATEIIHHPVMQKMAARLWTLTIKLLYYAAEKAEAGVLPSVDHMVSGLISGDRLKLIDDLNELSNLGIVGYDRENDRWFVTAEYYAMVDYDGGEVVNE